LPEGLCNEISLLDCTLFQLPSKTSLALGPETLKNNPDSSRCIWIHGQVLIPWQ
jgi:hypothetical protein